MHAEPQPAVGAAAEDKGFVHHDFLPDRIDQEDISHRDGKLAVNLNTVLRGIVIIPHFDPVF